MVDPSVRLAAKWTVGCGLLGGLLVLFIPAVMIIRFGWLCRSRLFRRIYHRDAESAWFSFLPPVGAKYMYPHCNEKFVRLYAWQILWVGLGVMFLSAIPGVSLLGLVLWIYLWRSAARGRWIAIPVIGQPYVRILGITADDMNPGLSP